jgi:hypothetical protein
VKLLYTPCHQMATQMPIESFSGSVRAPSFAHGATWDLPASYWWTILAHSRPPSRSAVHPLRLVPARRRTRRSRQLWKKPSPCPSWYLPWNDEKKRRLLQAAKFDGVQLGGPERRPDTKFGDQDREAGSKNNNEDTCDVPLQAIGLLHPCSRPLPSQSTLFMMPLNWSNWYAPRMEGTFHVSFDFGNTLTLCAI